MDDKQIIEHLRKMPIPNFHKFGLFKRGDDGLKEEVINQVLFEKTNNAIFRLVNDPSSRLAFLSGSHSRLGKNSSLRVLFKNSLYDKNVLPLVFELACIDMISVKKAT